MPDTRIPRSPGPRWAIRRAIVVIAAATALATSPAAFAAPMADLQLNAATSTPSVSPGAELLLTLTLKNNGDGDAPSATIAAALPDGLELVSVEAPKGSTYTAGTWAVPTGLGAGQQIILTLRVRASAPAGTTIAGSSEALCYCEDARPDNNLAGYAVVVKDAGSPPAKEVALPDLEVAIAPVGRPRVGAALPLVVTVRNVGTAAAGSVTVRGVLPAGLTFQSATPPGLDTYDPVTGLWTLADPLAPGEGRELTITAGVTGGVGTGLTGEAKAECLCEDLTPDNNLARWEASIGGDETPTADLRVDVLGGPASTRVGETVAYAVVLANRGPARATGIQVRIDVPAGLVARATAASGHYDATTGLWTVDALDVSDAVGLAISGRAGLPGGLEVRAEIVSAGQPDPDSIPANGRVDEDDVSAAVVAVEAVPGTPSAAPTPSSDPGAGAPPRTPESAPARPRTGVRPRIAVIGPPRLWAGQHFVYRIRVWNPSRVVARGVVVTGRVPAGVTLRSLPSGARMVNGVVRWRVGVLRPGSPRVLVVRAAVAGTARPRQRLRAEVAGANFAPVADRTSALVLRSGAPQRRTPAVAG